MRSFRIDNTDHIFDVNKKQDAHDQVDIVCPSPTSTSSSASSLSANSDTAGRESNNNETLNSQERYIIYSVSITFHPLSFSKWTTIFFYLFSIKCSSVELFLSLSVELRMVVNRKMCHLIVQCESVWSRCEHINQALRRRVKVSDKQLRACLMLPIEDYTTFQALPL